MIEFDATLARDGFRFDLRFESSASPLALFGRSGSGKSTALALLAGLLRPDRGRIRVGGELLVDTSRGVFVPPHRRRIGLVFQDSLLFPHLSVRRNLLYGHRFRGRSGSNAGLDAVVGMLGIAHLLERAPDGLSGGERQRVAIGRALLSSPRMLLLDEPLASLDYDRRREILPYVLRLRDDLRLPIVYVSHAVDEVARIAREVVVVDAGGLVAQGAPGDVLAPVHARGAEGGFGAVSVVEATVREHDDAYGLTVLDHPAGAISVPGRIGEAGHPYPVVIRATDVALAVQRPRDVSFRTVLLGDVVAVARDAGPIVRVEIRLKGGGRLVALVTRKALDELAIDAGDEVFAMVKAVALDDRSLAFAPRGDRPRSAAAGVPGGRPR